jgi:hypothetical protein
LIFTSFVYIDSLPPSLLTPTAYQDCFVKKYLSKLLLLLVLAAGAARPGQAQQLAQYSQYMNNNYLQQWRAPKTTST